MILRTPKVFQAPREEESPVLPKIIKFAIFLLILVLALIYLFLFSPIFKIKTIEVVGSPSDEVKQKLDDLKGKNIFSFSAKGLEDDVITRNQNYLSVKIYRGLPDTVKVKFQDREPKMIWLSKNQMYLVDKNGMLFQEIYEERNLPKVTDKNNLNVAIPTQIVTSSFVDFINQAKNELEKSDVQVAGFEVGETTFQIDALTERGIKIIMDTTRPLSEQLNAFNSVYEKNIANIQEYIDLRVEGWVYFK